MESIGDPVTGFKSSNEVVSSRDIAGNLIWAGNAAWLPLDNGVISSLSPTLIIDDLRLGAGRVSHRCTQAIGVKRIEGVDQLLRSWGRRAAVSITMLDRWGAAARGEQD